MKVVKLQSLWVQRLVHGSAEERKPLFPPIHLRQCRPTDSTLSMPCADLRWYG